MNEPIDGVTRNGPQRAADRDRDPRHHPRLPFVLAQ
jgi:hypothetical protein